jgi:uncharacterized protein YeaO (DUF488 family)
MHGRETWRRRPRCANGMGISRFAEFRRRYSAELARSPEQLDALRGLIKGHVATLLTATHDLALSHAEVLRGILLAKKK